MVYIDSLPADYANDENVKEILKSIETQDGWIIIKLFDSKPEYWAHIEGEIEITFDKYYIPLRVEIEIKDLMESEKVLKNAHLIAS